MSRQDGALAGARGDKTEPMDNTRRLDIYTAQRAGGKPTARQRRRLNHKGRRRLGRVRP